MPSSRTSRVAGAWCATATRPSGRSRPGSDRSRCAAPRFATVAPGTRRRSASPRRCCRRAKVNVGGWGSGGGLLLGRLYGLAVAEAHAFDQLAKTLGAVEATPASLGRLGELEHHRQRGLAG